MEDKMRKERFGWPSTICHLLMLLVFSWGLFSLPSSAQHVPFVVILNSYHQGYDWSDAELAGVITRLREGYPSIEPSVEHLDTKRFPDPAYLLFLKDSLAAKYRGKKPDLLITIDNPAFDLALRYRQELFSDTPIVFAGVNDWTSAMLQGQRGITGVAESQDNAGTLQLALKLHPRCREALVIHDYTASGLAVRREVEAALPNFPDDVKIRFSEPATFEEIAEQLRALPPDSIGLLLSFTTDSAGRTLSLAESTRALTAGESVPVYAMHETRLGFGIVGGILISGNEHGRRAGDLALRVLSGEDAGTIPVDTRSSSLPMFDYTQLDHFHIPLNALPPGSRVINRPESLLDKYRTETLIVLEVIGILLFLVLALIAAILQRRRVEAALRESEQRHRRYIESSPVAVLTADAQGRFLDANPAACALLGYEREELIGHSIPDTLPDDWQERGLQHFAAVRELGSARDEFPLKRKDGGLVWVNLDAVRLEQDRFVAFCTDLSERIRSQEKLRESEERYRLLAENVTDVVWRLDLRTQRFTYVSPSVLRLRGYTPEEVMAEPLQYSMTAESLPKVRELFRQKVRELMAGSNERIGPLMQIEQSRKDGGTIWIEVSTVYLSDEQGKPVEIIGVSRDISERKRMEEEHLRLEQHILQAQKMESLGVLAGGIAHDFNNILTAVLGFAEMALTDLSESHPARESIEEIQKAGQRAADLARQMLAYSGRGRFVIEPINLSTMIREMGQLLAISISKGVSLRYELADNLPLLEGDAAQMRQVILNLVTNASEAISGDGTVAVYTGAMDCDQRYLETCHYAYRPSADEPPVAGLYVYLEVTDTGSGMNAETQARIFDPFFSTKFTGRGLGLPVVLGIARGHRGAIRIQSAPGKGSSFRVLLPASASAVAQSEVGMTEAQNRWRGQGLVLLADDEPAVRAVGQAMLERLGFTVLSATDGREAVERFREHTEEIVCVLLDLVMPRLDGEAAFREIRAIRPDARVLLTSGYSEQEISERFAEAGIAGFLEKPFRFAALAANLRGATGQ
jgi:PAS domain S-box-containing protein